MYAYDFEVFPHDWLVVFKNYEETIVVHNDVNKLKQVIVGMKIPTLVGFNNYYYDDLILTKLLSPDVTKSEIYNLSQKIVKSKDNLFANLKILTLDVKQELALDLSLKSIEAHLGLDIVECSVPWNIDRPLTQEEIAEVTKYCIHDVDATLKIWKLRQDYFSAKANLVREFNLPYTALKKTQASLAAEVLNCIPVTPPHDRLKIDYDPNIDWELIPYNVRKFFEDTTKRYARNESFEKLEKREMSIILNSVPHCVGFGGLHGGLINYIGEGVFWHIDVSSYYPSLIINNNWMSRASLKPEKYKEIRDTRFKLKAQGDTREYVYKIILNSTFGAMKSKYNKLFDPKQANNICVNGQLILIQLIRELKPFIRLIQSNTDGLIVEVLDAEGIKLVLNSFSCRFNLDFSVTHLKKIVQRDVNNYAAQTIDGKIKTKGVFSEKSWKNNSLNIIPKALKKLYFEGGDLLDTIRNSNILDYQIVAKAGSKYDHISQNGMKLQKCNRIFATPNGSPIYKCKIKADQLTYNKIPNTSDKSTPWNGSDYDNNVTIDYNFYHNLISQELKSFQ